MAGIQFSGGKLHQATEVKAIFRDTCADERVKHTHSNKELDVTKTHLNSDLHGLSYQQMCDVYDERMKLYEANAPRKMRANTTTMIDLIITTPRDLPRDPAVEDAWYKDVERVINEHYGADVVLDIKIHRDEIHEYTDPSTGRQTMSRTHGHAFVFPEVDMRLNGKAFSSRKNILAVDREVDQMTRERYHCRYMTGDKVVDRRWQTVEQLKQASDTAALERRAQEAQKQIDEAGRIKAVIESKHADHLNALIQVCQMEADYKEGNYHGMTKHDFCRDYLSLCEKAGITDSQELDPEMAANSVKDE